MEYGLVALWLAVFLALLLAGVPIGAVLFGRLADRGVGVALPISATVIWLVGFWIGQLSLPLAPWAGVGVLGLLSAGLAWRRSPELDRRLLGETVGVFTLAFLFVVGIRAVDPAVHPLSGEKFLDFGLLQSLARTSQLPPADMWFAGEPVRYYYGGHLLVSLLSRLTGTAPRFAYNLGLAGFYAMLVTAVYGLAGSITASQGGPRRYGSLLGAFFVGFASNLSTVWRLVLWMLPDPIAEGITTLFSIPVGQQWSSPTSFFYWDASRIIPGTINEFPLFAWLNGDLHAHMMSTPFLVLTATVLFSYTRTPNTERTRRRLLVCGVLPLLAGLLAVVNTWSFPTVGGLTLVTLALAPSDPRTLLPATLASRLKRVEHPVTTELTRVVTAGLFGGLVVGLGVLVSGPFWLGTASGRAVGVFPDRSTLGGLLLIHGGFLVVFAPALYRQVRDRVGGRRRLGLALGLVVGLGLLGNAAAVALCLPLIVGGWLAARLLPTRDTTEPQAETTSHDGGRSSPGFETVLIVAGAGLVLLVEFLYVKEQAGPGRLNTVFKTYMQVWVLWSIAAGVGLTRLCWEHRPSRPLSGGQWPLVFRVVAGVLVVSTSIYGVFALAVHVTDDDPMAQTGDPTLDATQFVAEIHPDEAPAIRWIDRLDGQPTIVSAPGDYHWEPWNGDGASAAASLTGVPTVVGWHHEKGYRGEAAYDRRVADVETIYTGSASEQARLLASYNVSYIYVGPAERATYGEITVDRLRAVRIANQWEDVTIYRVNRQELGS